MASGDALALIGEVLGGRFRITSLIGEGSMGTVYCATDLRRGGSVALKVLARPVAADDTALARFKREAKAASRLRHDGCVEIIDYGVDAGLPYLAMELLSGETLYRLLERVGRLNQELAIAIAVKVCEVLEVAHEHGIVHRDLKPENIMVVPSQPGDRVRIKVLDFGIVKLVTPALSDDSQSSDSVASRLTHPGTALGTPAFMAPEQVRGDAIVDRTDIYVVGILLYEMVTGRVPFLGDDPVDVLQAQLRQPPPPPSEFAPDMHPELEAAILTCLEKSRAARWPTARLLRRKLEELLAELVDVRGAEPVVPERSGDGEEDYQLTEPVNLRWLQQRRAALLDIEDDDSLTDAETAKHLKAKPTRPTAETRVVDAAAGPDDDENIETSEMRAARGSSQPAAASQRGAPRAERQTAATAIRRPSATVGAEPSPRGTAETRLVGGTAARAVVRGGAAAPPPADDASEVPTIEVYDEDGQDVEMLISTMVKPLQNVEPELEDKLKKAGLGAWVGSRRGQDGTLIDEQAQQPAAFQPPQVAPSAPPPLGSSAPPRPAAVPEEAERTLHRKRDVPLPSPPRPALDSAISLDPADVDLIESSSDHDEVVPPSASSLLVEDEQLDLMKTVARTDLEEDEAAELSTRVKGSLDDMHDELATAVKPLSDDDIDAALATAVKPDEADAEDELETTVQAPEEAARELERAMAARGMTGAAADLEAATAVKSSLASGHADRETVVEPKPAAPEADDPEEMNPTTLMPRSQLSVGLPPHMQRALEAELGPIPDTVDDTPASVPAPASAPAPDRELPPLVEPKKAQRTVQLTAPLPQVSPEQAAGGQAPVSTQQPGALPGLEGYGGGDDLEELLQRMPRTRYPVASTFFVLLVMAALAAGLVWLLLY